MTGYTVNTGSTAKFSEGWDRIFGTAAAKSANKESKSPAAKPSPAAKKAPAAKPAAKKAAGKATAGKKVVSKRAAQTSRTSGKR